MTGVVCVCVCVHDDMMMCVAVCLVCAVVPGTGNAGPGVRDRRSQLRLNRSN